jgi:hypothetical protein
MLAVIELATHGHCYPFCLDACKSGYYLTVDPTPNPEHEGFTGEQITAANRAAYEAVVASSIAARDSMTF